MVLAFSNPYGGAYEGAANWQVSTLLALGTLPAPPDCLIVGASEDQLPTSLRAASHVRPVPVEDDPAWRAQLDGPQGDTTWHRGYDALAEEHQVDVWVGWHHFRGLRPGHRLMVVWPDFHPRRLVHLSPDLRLVILMEHWWKLVRDRADVIGTISEATAAEALDGCPDIADRLRILPFVPVIEPERVGLDPDAVRRSYNLPERFLIVGNQFWNHKNHIAVVEALGILRARGDAVPTVVFTGRTWAGGSGENFERAVRAAHRAGVHEHCRFLGHLPRSEQFALLRAARATVQPSLAEGRGAILEESLIVGTPVICSDLDVHREQAPAGAPFFDPDDREQLADALLVEQERTDRTDDEILRDGAERLARYGRAFIAACEAARVAPVAA